MYQLLSAGIGYASTVLIFNFNTYYMTILAWALRYLVASFSNPLPWALCDHDFNTENCYVFGNSTNATDIKEQGNGDLRSDSGNFTNSSTPNNASSSLVSSVVEYWE